MSSIALLVALYAVWRVAVATGRRRERSRRECFPFRGAAGAVFCGRCGRAARSSEMVVRGIGPWRSWRCREACVAGKAAEHEHAV